MENLDNWTDDQLEKKKIELLELINESQHLLDVVVKERKRRNKVVILKGKQAEIVRLQKEIDGE